MNRLPGMLEIGRDWNKKSARGACSWGQWCREQRSTRLKSNTLRPLRWVIVAALPLVAHGASIAQQEYDSVLRSKADLVRGEKLFETCAACHGTNGAGASDGTVPAIAAQHFRVLAHELVDYRHDKRWDLRM